MPKILGLDLGTNSIGWALIDDRQNKIIDSGVRIFQEGINRNTTGSEVSKNKDRRDARGARRMNARYKMRRDMLIEALQELNMFPQDGADHFFQIDPYQTRAKGLDEKLSLFELGRALFHLNQRRGFKSNRKTTSKEDGTIFKGSDDKIGIDEARKELKEHFRTLGEYLASLDPHSRRRRNRYTLRVWYEEEFNKLWEQQKQYYPDILTDENKENLFSIIFFQRPLKSQKHLVGMCTFEKKKRCSPKSSPVFQYFRILEQINRIRITTDERTNEPLNENERSIVINKLQSAKELNFKQMVKLLDLPDDTRINLDTEKLLGNITYYEILQIFGKERYSKLCEEDKYTIWHTIHFANDDDWLRNYARNKWQLDEKSVDRLMKTTMESGPNNGYARLSHKAMKKIIPELEQGMRYDQAAWAAGYHHSEVDKIEELQEFLDDPENIRNPIVQQSLYQLKKVVNTLIHEYGKPDIIRVELARELKASKQQRDKMRIENKIRQKEAEKIRERLSQEFGFSKPSRDDVIKFLLFEECSRRDPYSGDVISVAALFSGEYEIEHIIPYSRSLDDSFANKTLCRKDYNNKKGNKTPYEAFGATPEYELMLNRVKKFKGKYAFGKLRKFTIKDADKELEDFVARQLNDTAYISREARKYLQTICKKVQVAKGGATAKLRYLWGLNSILSGDIEIKTRDDHRHHAVDALVVANITPHMLHKLSSYHKYNYSDKTAITEHRFPMPWDHFHEQAQKSINDILVSFHCRNRVRGKLHEETNYGQIIDPETGEKVYVVRKKIESITAKMITNIVNKETRNLILNRLREFGVDTLKKFKIPKEAFAEPILHPKTGHQIKSVRVKIPSSNMIALYGEDRKLFVESGSNHHIEIFANPDNSKKVGYIVTLYEAIQRKRKGKPIVNTSPIDKE